MSCLLLGMGGQAAHGAPTFDLSPQLNFYKAKWDGGDKSAFRLRLPPKNECLRGPIPETLLGLGDKIGVSPKASSKERVSPGPILETFLGKQRYNRRFA